MVNAMQLLQNYREAESMMAARRQAMAMQDFQMAQNAMMAPLQREQIQQNMLMQRKEFDANQQHRNAMLQSQERHRNAMLESRDRAIAAKSHAPQKPQWDSTRGVWVTPPSPGAPAGAGGVVRPEGLPENLQERKAREEAEKEQKRLGGAINKTDIVIGKVDEALKQTGFWSTGLTGETIGKVPGTGAYDLGKTLDTIKANLGFRELQEMREASPTGGALGQVAVQELNFLQGALANLDKGQSEAQLRKNLGQVKKHFDNWKKAVGGQGQPAHQEAEDTKSIGGKTYIKVGGKWFEK